MTLHLCRRSDAASLSVIVWNDTEKDFVQLPTDVIASLVASDETIQTAGIDWTDASYAAPEASTSSKCFVPEYLPSGLRKGFYSRYHLQPVGGHRENLQGSYDTTKRDSIVE